MSTARLIKLAYGDYLEKISSECMAISLECAYLLHRKIESIRPRSVADLGSGFSTFVMLVSTPPEVPVCVVDSSRTWLARTREFCERSVPQEKLAGRTIHWLRIDALDQDAVDFDVLPKGFKAEFVFFDIDSSKYRTLYLPLLAQITGPGSVVCFDDMHKPTIFEMAQKFSREWKKTLPPVAVESAKDRFGRFQAIATCVA